jgi:hypothetical protein
MCGACRGDLVNMQEILKNSSYVLTLSTFQETFNFACSYDHLHVAQWSYQIKSDINIGANNVEAFRFACKHGHLVMAQWLYEIKPNIVICAKKVIYI